MLAPCVKVYISMKSFPGGCRKYVVILLISFPVWVNVTVDCGVSTVGMFLLLTGGGKISIRNDLETTEAIFDFSLQFSRLLSSEKKVNVLLFSEAENYHK